ncbi:hypothetical protein PG991_003194 [Apiospora marii]|uniref:C2H2-type domain-containing protein n=1 Tax=Apiospora marii TaxID=335849 RepID=A0ABR1SHK8_9PEZI
MAGNHGPSWAFTADLPSSPRPGNRPEAANPDDQPMTFRAPSTDPSESDEVLVDAAHDEEEVRGYVTQDVEAAVEESMKDPVTDKDVVMALDEDESISSEEPEVWSCGFCSLPYTTPWELRDHLAECHDCDAEGQLDARGIGLIWIWDLQRIKTDHERLQGKHLAETQRTSRREQLDIYIDEAQMNICAMSYFMDKLLSEDMQSCPDPVFQSKRGEAALSYIAAERRYTHHKRELDMLRHEDGPDRIFARYSGLLGGGAASWKPNREEVDGETRFVFPNANWDEMTPLAQARALLNDGLARTNMVPIYLYRMGRNAGLLQLEVCEQPQPEGPLGPEFERYDPPVDWRALNDSEKAHIVLWGRWGEVGRNVPAYLRHLRVQAGTMHKDYFDELYQKQRRQEQNPQQTDPESQKEEEGSCWTSWRSTRSSRRTTTNGSVSAPYTPEVAVYASNEEGCCNERHGQNVDADSWPAIWTVVFIAAATIFGGPVPRKRRGSVGSVNMRSSFGIETMKTVTRLNRQRINGHTTFGHQSESALMDVQKTVDGGSLSDRASGGVLVISSTPLNEEKREKR